MRRVAIDAIHSEMYLGKTIYSADGRVLLAKGVKLLPQYIAKLKSLGLGSVYVCDSLTDDIEVPEFLSEETRLKSTLILKKFYQKLSSSKVVMEKEIYGVAKNLIDEITCNRNVLVNLVDVRTYDDYTFYHSVSVCSLAILIGLDFGYNEIDLRNLALGALLHDLGKTKISLDILNKPGKLDPIEFEVIKGHSGEGFDLLRKHADISLLSSHVAFQHHEKWDGSGYPRGLKGEDIHPYARIVAVADVFDALVSDRPYRRGFSYDKALKIINEGIGTHFDPYIVEILKTKVAPYPVGTYVELSNGLFGVVVDVHKEFKDRPVVRVFDSITEFYEVDLSKSKDIVISETVDEGCLISRFGKVDQQRN